MAEWPIDFDPKDALRPPSLNISDALYKEIGRFMVNWGVLESELDVLIAVLYTLDPTYALTITANQGTKSKVEIARSAVDMLREPLGERFTTRADGILITVQQLATGSRNVIAHGHFQAILPKGGRRKTNHILRFSARKELQLKTYPLTAKMMRQQASQIWRLAADVRRLIPHVIKTVKGLTADDYDRLCVTR